LPDPDNGDYITQRKFSGVGRTTALRAIGDTKVCFVAGKRIGQTAICGFFADRALRAGMCTDMDQESAGVLIQIKETPFGGR
jgi:hypothetical protein